jgi:hypothetical protein
LPASKSLAGLGALLVLATGTTTSAHRLDEYLQAALIAIDPGRVSIELNLTPGVAIADRILADVDADGSGVIDPAEARAHGQRARSAIALDVDGVPLDVNVTDSRYPSVGAVRQGQGTIHLRLAATLPVLSAGAHRLRYRNAHRPDIGVYLANALVPVNDRVVIRGQERDVAQRELVVDYELRGGEAARSQWALFALTGVLATLAACGSLISRLLPALHRMGREQR